MRRPIAAITALPAFMAAVLAGAGPASAQVFELVHPELEEGGFEVEILNGFTLGGVAPGDERTAHEVAVAYAPFEFWKTTIAFEFVSIRGDGGAVEAMEWENLFLLPLGHGGHGHGHGDGHGHAHDGDGFFSLEAVGLFVGLEVPKEGGIGAGGVEIGPVAEFTLGPVTTVANLAVEIPFENGEDPGLAYGIGASVPVGSAGGGSFAVGAEAFGGAEGLFGDTVPLDQNSHVIGPALYGAFDLGDGRELEPRLAVLFGLTDASPDAVISFNIETKF